MKKHAVLYMMLIVTKMTIKEHRSHQTKLYRFINDKLHFKQKTVVNYQPVCGAPLIDYTERTVMRRNKILLVHGGAC